MVRRFLSHSLRRFPALFPLALALLLVGQLLEGVGLGLFLPLIELLSGSGASSSSGLSRLVRGLFDGLGVPLRLGPILVLMFLLVLGKALLQVASQFLASWLYTAEQRRLQTALYEAVLEARYTFLLARKSGHLSSVLTLEIARAASGISALLAFFAELLSIAVYVGASLLLNWQVTVAALALGGVTYLAVRPIVMSGHALGQRRQDAASELQSLVQESLGSLGSIKGMGREAPFRRQFAALAGRIQAAEARRGLNAALLGGVSEPVIMLALCGMIYVAVTRYSVDFASFLLLLGILYRTFRRFNVLPTNLHNMLALLPSLEVVDRWLEEARAEREAAQGGCRLQGFDSLAFEGVSFTYAAGPEVLAGIDLEVRRGQMIAVVGQSGAGKTTLIGLVLGLLRGYRGRVVVNGGTELGEIDPADWRRRIGYVGQDIHLFHATVAENIAFLEEGLPREQLIEAARQAHCLEFIERLPAGLDTLVGDRGTRLSGGQRQRLALARALAGRPEILVLDEATSDLDSESEARIQESIAALRGRLTILAIAHRLSTIRDADRIVVLSGGRKVEEGTCRELLEAQGEFARLYQRQMEGAPTP